MCAWCNACVYVYMWVCEYTLWSTILHKGTVRQHLSHATLHYFTACEIINKHNFTTIYGMVRGHLLPEMSSIEDQKLEICIRIFLISIYMEYSLIMYFTLSTHCLFLDLAKAFDLKVLGITDGILVWLRAF